MIHTINLFYEVAMNDRLIVSLACDEIDHPPCAEATILYRDRDGKVFGITCYLLSYAHDQIALPAILQMMSMPGGMVN